MPKKPTRTNRLTQILYWANVLAVGFLVASYLLAAHAIITSQLVPAKYLIPGVVVSGAIVAAFTYVHVRKTLPTGKNVACIIVSLLLGAVSMYVYTTTSVTTSFLQNIQETAYITEEYSIIAKKDDHIALAPTSKYAAALLKPDPNSSAVRAEANKKFQGDYKEYDNLTSVVAALDTNQAPLGVLKTSQIELIKENSEPFYQRIEVLSTFTIKTKTSASGVKTDTSKPFVVYISGIDTYGAIDTVSRSDVNMLAIINPQTRKVLLVNTPRDYYVQLHGTTGVKDKLTHAGIYGIDMSRTTLEDLYDTPINYYMRVNFSSLTGIINVLGGVNVYSDYTFSSGKDTFTQGYNSLNADQALAFSRTRYAFQDGDRTRGKNQQKVIEAIIAKMNSPSNLAKYQNILGALNGTFQTNMSPQEITSVVNAQLNDMKGWQTESISVDGAGSSNYTYSMGDIKLYVMEPNADSLEAAKAKIRQYRQGK